MQLDSTKRFSDRVDNYARFRPGYPHELIDILEKDAGCSTASVIADVGSGTGISARMFLEHGCIVYGVEPTE